MNRLHLTQSHRAVAAGVTLVMALMPLLVWVRPRRFVVSGVSMVPTLQPGDRLVVARLGRVVPGDLVVVRDPRSSSRLICKRVVSREHRHVIVRGDNADASTDSRAFGPVPIEWVVGRVLHRYWPEGAGRPL